MLRKQQVWTLILYSVPYIYLVFMVAAYGQSDSDWLWRLRTVYALALTSLPVAQLALCAYCAHRWNTRLWVIPGNVLNIAITYCAVSGQRAADPHFYLEPFSPAQALFWLTLLAVIAQLCVLGWCKKHRPYAAKKG